MHEPHAEVRWMDFIIRVAVIFTLIFLCARIALPFLGPAMWGIVLAVTLRPVQLRLGGKIGERAAAVCLGVGLLLLLLIPAVLFVESLVFGVKDLVIALREGTVTIPPPPEAVERLPLVGKRLTRVWDQASTNLTLLLETEAGRVQAMARRALELTGDTLAAVGQFAISTVIATILLMRYEQLALGARAFACRLAGDRGELLVAAAGQTVRSVALGVIGVAAAQSLLTGVGLVVAGVPAAGLLSIVTLVLCVVQLGPTLVLLGATIWMFSTADTLSAALFLVFSVIVATMDNVLKPLIFSRGARVPIIVVFVGAIGGFLRSGIIGLFTGAVLLVLGYELFRAWLRGTEVPLPEPKVIGETAAPEPPRTEA